MASGLSVKEEKVAVAFLKYSICILSSSALYIAFKEGIFSSIAIFTFLSSSFTSSPETRTQCASFKAQSSTLGFSAICFETFFILSFGYKVFRRKAILFRKPLLWVDLRLRSRENIRALRR